MTFEQALEAMKKEPGVVFIWGDGNSQFRYSQGKYQSSWYGGKWKPVPFWSTVHERATDWRKV